MMCVTRYSNLFCVTCRNGVLNKCVLVTGKSYWVIRNNFGYSQEEYQLVSG